jgi:glutaredoxin 3
MESGWIAACKIMQPVVMYSTGLCPYCRRAKALLASKGIAFEEIRIDMQPSKRAEMIERSGRYTVPQIWIGKRHVGGSDELHALVARGELDTWLAD